MGVPLPWSVAILLRASVPAPALSRVALLGLNFKDEEAVALGLGHEVAEAEGFEAACLARLQEFADKDARAVRHHQGLPAGRRRSARCAPRKPRAQGEFLDAWFSPEARARIQETVDALGQKS